MANAVYHSNSYLERPLTDEEKLLAHQWSLDWQIAENERLFPTNDDVDYPRDSVDVPNLLLAAGFENTAPPAEPSPAGQPLYTGPLVVEGENDVPPEPGETGTRVPLPRDHPLTGSVDTGQDLEGFDEDAARAEIAELNVEELKENLGELDKPVGGNKAELQDRLLQALREAHDAE